MEITKSVACFSMIMLLSGCTALLWSQNKVAESYAVDVLQMQDNVSDIFQYNNLSASVVKGKTSIPLNIPAEGVAFLGEKNIYILTTGSDELLDLNKVTDRLPLISGGQENTLKLHLAHQRRGDATAHFKDALLVKVNKRNDEISPEDMKIIEQFDFRESGGGYWKKVDIEGVIIPKKSLSYTFSQTQSLGVKYRVEFYSRDRNTDFHPLNLATNVVFTPLTLAADIVFFPISIRFFQAVGNASAFSH